MLFQAVVGLCILVGGGQVANSKQLTGYCTGFSNDSTSEPATEPVQDAVVSSLWTEFRVEAGYTSLRLSLFFNQSTMCQLEKHNLKKFRCKFLYAKASTKSSRGKKRSSAISTISNFSSPQIFNITKLKSNTKYSFWLQCSLQQDGNKRSYKSQSRDARTKGFLDAPSTVSAFVSHHRYDVVKKSPWVTLEWSRIKFVDAGLGTESFYQTRCLQLLPVCFSKCAEDFGVCSTCVRRAKRLHWSNKQTVPWLYTAASIPQRQQEHIDSDVSKIVCGVRGVNKIMEPKKKKPVFGSWSNPVFVDLAVLQPAPRLLILGQLGHHIVRATFDTAMAFREGSLSVPYIRKYRSFGEIFGTKEMDFECCITSNEPRIVKWPFKGAFKNIQDGPIGFCLNWVHEAFYTVITCEDDLNQTCMYKNDGVTQITGNSLLLHKAGVSSPFQHIVCNPFKDVVAATKKKSGFPLYDLVVYHETANTTSSRLVDLHNCSSFMENTGGIGSPAISVDWKNDGAVLVIGKTGEIWALNLEYGKECVGTKVGAFPSSQNVLKITQLTADWQHFYWMTDKQRVYMIRRNHTSVPVQIKKTFEHTVPCGCGSKEKPCRGLQKAVFKKVISIKAAAPDMRKFVHPALYFPVIQNVQVVMVGENTATVQVAVEWKSDLVSLRPSLKLRIRFKLYEDGDRQRGCNLRDRILGNPRIKKHKTKKQNRKRILANCESVSSSEVTRNNTLIQSISNLESGKQYYLEVYVSTPEEWRYELCLRKLGVSTNQTFNATYIKPNGSIVINNKINKENKNLWIVGLAVGISALLLTGAAAYLGYYYHYRIKPYKHLIRRNGKQIRRIRSLGAGHFGEVWEANLTDKSGPPCRVAVKTLLENSDAESKKSFLEEAIILGHLNHQNILKIKGISLDSKPNMIVLEFINGGCLSSRLHNQQNSMSRTEQLLTASDVCNACIYLSDKGYIHRDIRSANVLIQTTKQGSKFRKAVLADFGLAKDRGGQLEPYTTNAPQFPVRYSAPECFEGQFTSANDVYMFGILLWEIFSHGRVPNAHIPLNELICRIQHQDCKPEKPGNCPDEIYRIMADCWIREPKDRPCFRRIKLDLDICKRNPPNADPYHVTDGNHEQPDRPHVPGMTITAGGPNVYTLKTQTFKFQPTRAY